MRKLIGNFYNRHLCRINYLLVYIFKMLLFVKYLHCQIQVFKYFAQYSLMYSYASGKRTLNSHKICRKAFSSTCKLWNQLSLISCLLVNISFLNDFGWVLFQTHWYLFSPGWRPGIFEVAYVLSNIVELGERNSLYVVFYTQCFFFFLF